MRQWSSIALQPGGFSERISIKWQHHEVEMYARFPWYVWPLVTVVEILNHLFFVTLHFFGSFMGLLCILVGLFLTATIVGAVIGLPLVLAGIAIRYHFHFSTN